MIAYIEIMTHLRSLLIRFAVLTLPLPAMAEVPLDQLSAYLNSLSTEQATFTQINADGSKAHGQITIQRPGRARFEYAAPDKSLVIASGGMVAIFDAKSNQPPEQYPLARTPLNLILARDVDLGAAKMVVGHSDVGGSTHVIAQDPQHPDYGTIELVFSAAPIALKSWIITDDIGNQTSVTLGDLTPRNDVPASQFSIDLETRKRGN